MANLVFPQLSSGAIVQYPVTRNHLVRTVKNAMPSGDLVLHQDVNAQHLVWNLEYRDLTASDLALLQNHFAACNGPFRAFTFLDPAGNLLAWTSDLTQPVWSAAGLSINRGTADPTGGVNAFTITNESQAQASLLQTLPIPASYQYVFSTYIQSSAGAAVTLALQGSSASQSETFAASGAWQRVLIGAALQDSAPAVSAAITLAPGASANIYAPQLEPQLAPSRARLTSAISGVYTDAHWGVNALPVVATSPGLFSTYFTVEAGIG